MGIAVAKLWKRVKRKRKSQPQKKQKKRVFGKKGRKTSKYSKRSVRSSTRSKRNNESCRLQTDEPTYVNTQILTDPYSIVTDAKEQPVNRGGTQPKDSQRRKTTSIRRGKGKGTQRSQKGRVVVERRPLNDIFPKTDDTTEGGQIYENNTEQRGTKLRASQRSAKGSVRRRKSSRKLKKHLYPSPAVFSQIDANAIKAGEELRRRRIFSVKAITQAITVGAATELQKLRAIWIWLCHNIEYDVSGYLGETEKVTAPERVIETGRGVCSGYSRVCLEMCREVGIECREVSGHSKGSSYRPGLHADTTKSNHAWNAVSLQGQWYLLDSCWGAGTVDFTKKAFNKTYNEFYFLTEPDMFINDHYPDDTQWQLLRQPISLKEFQKRVLKTSRFFQLGLTLHHPTYYLLETENGEATISMTFPEPLQFIYKVCQRSGFTQRELSTSAAFLTHTSTHMKLRLRPPTQGVFDVLVYARTANTSGTFPEVCNFLLECSKPSPLEPFPENPSMSWGLEQKARSLGFKPCQYEPEIKVASGTFEMVLQTSRPLLMLCNLLHKDLDEELAKRCVATQCEPDQLTCHVRFPKVGYYHLAIYVKDNDSTSNTYNPAGDFLLHCTSNTVININKLFPAGLSNSCGPGNTTLNAGLADFSHTRAIINTQRGQCSITFHNQHGMKLQAELSGQDHQQTKHPLSRYVLLSCDEKDVTISVALPQAGVYRLSLYGGPANTTSLTNICDYVLQNDWDGTWAPFPLSYSIWNDDGCVLFEPRTGQLQPMSMVRFCVKVPKAKKVCVIGQNHMDLHLNQLNQMWEGEVNTGTTPQLQLAASYPAGEPGKLSVLLCFDVLRTPNRMR